MPANDRRPRMPAERRREQLIDVATSMLSRGGYHRFSLTELATSVGMTRPGVTHHVGSKEALLLDVLRARDRRGFAEMRAVLLDNAGRLRSALDAQVRSNIEDPELVRLYTLLAAESIEPTHPTHDYFQARWDDGVREMASVLDDAGRDGVAVAERIYSFLDGLQLNWLRDPRIDMWSLWTAFADDLRL